MATNEARWECEWWEDLPNKRITSWGFKYKFRWPQQPVIVDRSSTETSNIQFAGFLLNILVVDVVLVGAEECKHAMAKI